MEKLEKAKHNHKLTDIIKVMIFALILVLPFLVFLPTGLYYGFNEHAKAEETTKPIYEEIPLSQLVVNGKPVMDEYDQINYWTIGNNTTATLTDNGMLLEWEWDGNGNMGEECILFQVWIGDIKQDEIFSERDSYCLKWTIQKIEDDTDEYEYTIYNDGGQVLYDNYISQITDNNLNTRIEYLQFNYDFTEGNITYYYFGGYTKILVKNIQLFDLSIMYDREQPTNEQINNFLANYTEEYYEYKVDGTTQHATGNYIKEIGITQNMTDAWQNMWDTDLFSWTKNSPFKTSINGFLGVFNIPNTSGLGLYLEYLITMVGIYVVFDIVIQLFKWLTHMIGEK